MSWVCIIPESKSTCMTDNGAKVYVLICGLMVYCTVWGSCTSSNYKIIDLKMGRHSMR